MTKLSVNINKIAVVRNSRGGNVPNLLKAALDIERGAKTRAPVDTGNLKNSISVTLGDAGLAAEIGPTARYGIYLEYGTRHMSPRPYMGPAAEAVEPGFVEAIEQLGGTFL